MKCLVFSSLLLLFALFNNVHAHSWVACADYNGGEVTYDASKCKSYARNWYNQIQYAGPTFGVDTGYNYQPADNSHPCKEPFASPVSKFYNTTYPMSTYKAGQSVTLAWPSKGHVAAKCTGEWINETEFAIYRSGVNPTSDPSLDTFKKNLVANWTLHVTGTIDYKGYHHCPDFCNNMDKSLCTGTFIVPNIDKGSYVFLWYWIFNPGEKPYTTCFDVTIA